MAPPVETAEQNRTSLLRSLRRVTTSGRYIPEIDGLRFVAILSVILYHVTVQLGIPAAGSYWLWYLISHGARGVELFFLISGFILGLPFATHLLTAGRPVRLRDYFLRRVTRLEPPYILAILIRIPLLILIMHKPLHFVLTHGLASLFYLHSLIFGAASAVNPPAWSLEVEIQFYCLAPILAWSYFRLRPKSLRRLLGLTFILLCGLLQVHYLSMPSYPRLSLSILNYAQYFFAGFWLCDLYLEDWDRIPSHWLWDLVSLPAWGWIFLAEGWKVHVFLPFAILVVYLGAFKGYLFPSFFRTVWVSLIGGMCYSIYLTHNLAITGAGYLLHRWLSSPTVSNGAKDILAYGAVIPLVLAVGLVLYILVERPCMDKNWPSKLRMRLRGQAVPLQ